MKYKPDPECIELCQAINKIPGLKIFEARFWGREDTMRIKFIVEDPAGLPILLYPTGPYGIADWSCRVYTDCGMESVLYILESSSRGSIARMEAQQIADWINDSI